MEKTRVHETSTSLVKPTLAEFYAGTDIPIKVRVSSPCGCDLRGNTVNIIAEGTPIRQLELVEFDGAANETEELLVRAPIDAGEYAWVVAFPAQEKDGVLHEGSSVPLSLLVKPHMASIAVWDVPSPLVVGERFKARVGVKCSAGCNLAGKKIEVYDHRGARVAGAVLGDSHWPDTEGLFWAEVELEAPAAEGTYAWAARLPPLELQVSHGEVTHTFRFRTGKPAEHAVTVQVFDQDTGEPLEDAQVILQPYVRQTNHVGVAVLEVSRGAYGLYVCRHGYQIHRASLDVHHDVEVKVGLAAVPHDANEEG